MANVSSIKTEGPSARKLPLLPNFRRFLRDPNASDPSKEDPVIKHFHVCLPPDFKEELKLPVQFCHKLAKNFPSDAILISYKGMWKIAFGRCSCHKDLVLSGDGWLSFIHHHDLKKGHFVWFEQTDSMVFRVRVFDLFDNAEKFSCSENEPWDRQVAGSRSGTLHQHGFTANIKEFHFTKAYLSIPAEFLKKVDLTHKKWLILVNSSGHAWEVTLRLSLDNRVSENAQRDFKMRRGWTAFFKSNKLQVGDSVDFFTDSCSRLSSPDNLVMNVRIRRNL